MKTPKYFVWEPVIVEKWHDLIFWKIETILFDKKAEMFFYTVSGVDWPFYEGTIDSASIQAKNKDSKTFGIFPFFQ